RSPKHAWLDPIERGARWIARKRTPLTPGSPHAGLLPAGFSAEHLGPVDHYYWDDFWGVAGLAAAARLLARAGRAETAAARREAAAAPLRATDGRLPPVSRRLGRPAMPAAPPRRLDSGAVGSLAAGYPLQIVPADDSRLLDTAEYLLEECFFDGGFFQDM